MAYHVYRNSRTGRLRLIRPSRALSRGAKGRYGSRVMARQRFLRNASRFALRTTRRRAVMALGGGAGLALAAGYGAYRAGRAIRARRVRRRVMGSTYRHKCRAFYAAGDRTGMGTLARSRLRVNALNFLQNQGATDQLHKVDNIKYFLKGFAVDALFRNNSDGAINVHWAIVQIKRRQAVDDSAPSSGAFEGEFFNDPFNSTDRKTDFNTAQGSWDRTQDQKTINTDKFHILFHKRFELGQAPVSTSATQNSNEMNLMAKNWTRMRFYQKINKWFAFDAASGDNQVENPMFQLVWYESILPSQRTQDDLELNIMYKSVCKD